MAEFNEQLSRLNAFNEDLSDPKNKIHIELEFEEGEYKGGPCFVATESTNIVAWGKGDEAMAIIAGALQVSANDLSVIIIHRGMPSNPAAVALFKRTIGYEQVEVEGEMCYDKVFQPELAKKV